MRVMYNGRPYRRKPILLVGAPIVAFCIYALYHPPANKTKIQTATWLAVCLLMLGLVPVRVAWDALGAELTWNEASRNRLFAVVQVFASTGFLIGAVLPMVMFLYYSENHGVVLGILSVYCAIFYVIGFWGVCAFVDEPLTQTAEQRIPFIPAMRAVLRNGPYQVVLVLWGLAVFAGVMGGNLQIFLVQYVCFFESLSSSSSSAAAAAAAAAPALRPCDFAASCLPPPLQLYLSSSAFPPCCVFLYLFSSIHDSDVTLDSLTHHKTTPRCFLCLRVCSQVRAAS
jgi:Na+/melibiose symporter-like transporter